MPTATVKPGIKTTEFWILAGIYALEALREVVGNGITWQEVIGVALVTAMYIFERMKVKTS